MRGEEEGKREGGSECVREGCGREGGREGGARTTENNMKEGKATHVHTCTCV